MLNYCIFCLLISVAVISFILCFGFLVRKCLKIPNETNSSASVTCVAENDCKDRHTGLCKTCKYNHCAKEQSYYKKKKVR